MMAAYNLPTDAQTLPQNTAKVVKSWTIVSEKGGLPWTGCREGGGALASIDVAQAGLMLCTSTCSSTGHTGATALMQQMIWQSLCLLCGTAGCMQACCPTHLVSLQADTGMLTMMSHMLMVMSNLRSRQQAPAGHCTGRNMPARKGKITPTFK